MAINSDLLLRVSSVFDKYMDHPRFIDSLFPLKYLQADFELYRKLVIHQLFQRKFTAWR
jgi:hypothetical protein